MPTDTVIIPTDKQDRLGDHFKAAAAVAKTGRRVIFEAEGVRVVMLPIEAPKTLRPEKIAGYHSRSQY